MASTSATDAKVAAYWEKEGDGVRCSLCPHRCRIAPGKSGICGVRENHGGTLYAATYGKAAAVSVDPVEKKPLFHFHPGAPILSIGSVGCNFRCEFCQNYHLVLRQVPLEEVRIGELIRSARREGSVGIAYTYNEPFIQFEFVLECSRAFRAAGMKNVLVTNGYVNQEPLAELLPLVDAMNIDLKSMDPDFYRRICGGNLAPVLETIRTAAKATHVELTTLLYTGHNDADPQIRKVVDFVAETDPGIPLHLSRYFPAHRATAPPTPPDRLAAAYRIARERLPYVYVGNVRLPGAEDTVCPECHATVIRREAYRIDAGGLSGDRCAACGARLRFVV
ncbi:MAG: Radical domain protein [Deltaproteobacteria bacterium]|nr:Radical domain protein [Deltaproteobacteria bacterium]